jgi:hypothetical protein
MTEDMMKCELFLNTSIREHKTRVFVPAEVTNVLSGDALEWGTFFLESWKGDGRLDFRRAFKESQLDAQRHRKLPDTRCATELTAICFLAENTSLFRKECSLKLRKRDVFDCLFAHLLGPQIYLRIL